MLASFRQDRQWKLGDFLKGIIKECAASSPTASALGFTGKSSVLSLSTAPPVLPEGCLQPLARFLGLDAALLSRLLWLDMPHSMLTASALQQLTTMGFRDDDEGVLREV